MWGRLLLSSIRLFQVILLWLPGWVIDLILYMKSFKAKLEIIGINPFVFVPARVLTVIFKDAGKYKGHIPVSGSVNSKPYAQTLLKYKGDWRLYINTSMLPHSPKRIGEIISVSIKYDPKERIIKPHPKLVKSLKENIAAKRKFDSLVPSRRKEIVRYIANLKTEKSIDENIKKAINHLLGKDKFVGRDNP
jgi:hypothetical protein